MYERESEKRSVSIENEVIRTLVERVVRTSESIAWASVAAPFSPNKGMSRVLLLPGVGHLATTTMVPVIVVVVMVGVGARK